MKTEIKVIKLGVYTGEDIIPRVEAVLNAHLNSLTPDGGKARLVSLIAGTHHEPQSFIGVFEVESDTQSTHLGPG